MSQNFLNGVNFRLIIDKIPNVTFYSQDVTIPSISTSFQTLPTPFKEMNIAGGTLNFSELVFTFKVDEDLVNYKEMFSWFLQTSTQEGFLKSEPSKNISDATLIVLGSNGKEVGNILFTEIFPVQMSGFNFVSNSSDTNYVTVTVSFKINQMKIN